MFGLTREDVLGATFEDSDPPAAVPITTPMAKLVSCCVIRVF